MSLVGDGLHNFMDGIAIATAFSVSPAVGVATTMAIVLHEIPHEVGNYATLVHAGFSRGKALALNLLVGLTAVLGAGVALVFIELIESAGSYLSVFAAGSLLYIAMSDLIPEVHSDHEAKFKIWPFLALVAGIMMLYGLTWLES
jgi:zinc and cadmium transporter